MDTFLFLWTLSTMFTYFTLPSDLRSCVKVEAAVLGSRP